MKMTIMMVLSFLFLGCRTLTPLTMAVSKEYSVVTVNYDRPVEDIMVKGNYRRFSVGDQYKVDLKNFLSDKKGIADLKMKRLCFNSPVRPARVLLEMNKMGFAPVNLQELIAYFEKYPLASEGRGVGALGSLWYDNEGRLFSPAIWGEERILGLVELGIKSHERGTEGMVKQGIYEHGHCFVVVPK